MGQCNWCVLQSHKRWYGPENISLVYDVYGKEFPNTWVKVLNNGNPVGSWFLSLPGFCVCGEQDYAENYHFRAERIANGRKREVEFDLKKVRCSPPDVMLWIFQKRIRKPQLWVGAKFFTTNQSDGQVIEGRIGMKNSVFCASHFRE